jgi:hypothetical protein
MREINIEGDLIISNPLGRESKDITDSKTYRDWQSSNLNHSLQVVQYDNISSGDDWRMSQISLTDDSKEIDTLLNELFHNKPTDKIEPNKFSDHHWVKEKHTWRTCNHSFYVYEYWLNVKTGGIVREFSVSKPTLTGYFIRGGA